MNVSKEINRMNIIIGDDNEFSREFINMFFQREGSRIDTIEAAQKGIIIPVKQHYDILVTNNRLPIRHITELSFISFNVPSTTHDNLDILPALSGIGMNEYIDKPFLKKLINDVPVGLLDKKRKEGGSESYDNQLGGYI
jgi:DNA-binding response OmpR family regulator